MHKKVCLGFPSKKASGVLDSKPKSGRGNGRQGASSKVTPKKDSKGGTAANSQGSSALSASQTSPCHSVRGTSHQHKSKKDDVEKWKKVASMSPTQKSVVGVSWGTVVPQQHLAVAQGSNVAPCGHLEGVCGDVACGCLSCTGI